MVNAVETTSAQALSEVEKTAREALDISVPTNQDLGKRGGPGRAALPSPGSSGNLRTRLWANLERLFQDSVYMQCTQVRIFAVSSLCVIKHCFLSS